MEEGGPGEYPYYAVEKGCSDNRESEPCRRVNGTGRVLDAFDRQFEQPGYGQGKGVGAEKEQGAEKIAAPVFQEIAFKKEKFANGAPLESIGRQKVN